jgi:hypothetical protein
MRHFLALCCTGASMLQIAAPIQAAPATPPAKAHTANISTANARLSPSGVTVRELPSTYSASVTAMSASSSLTISDADFSRDSSVLLDAWLLQSATDSPAGCTIFISGTATGMIPLELFRVKPRNMLTQGTVATDWRTGSGESKFASIPASPTPIWSSTSEHASANAFALDFEVYDLDLCVGGSHGLSLTFMAVPNAG